MIIDRRVNVGQTVTMVPGFNAPGLFLIAKDSRQVQVWASVNEADIAFIHPGCRCNSPSMPVWMSCSRAKWRKSA